MGRFAKGKNSQAISDRSGQAFPYSEMVKEWNGSIVHISEFEAKHPQLTPKVYGADPQALLDARPQKPDLTKSFTLYINNNPDNLPQFNSFSMLPSSSDNIIGTSLTSFSAETAIGNVTVSIT
jgi:hypothetical protein|tara:strand:- start:95 stop:463 length:369 start_codon:yes stop_codon:yes gene_type:complete